MKRNLFILVLVLLVLPLFSRASAYWMEIHGSGKLGDTVRIQVCYGFIDELSTRHRDTGAELELIRHFKMYVLDDEGRQSPIDIKKQKDCWEGVFIPREEGCYRILGINDQHPVVDRSESGGKNIRPIDYLGGIYTVDCISPKMKGPKQFLDIHLEKREGVYTVQAFQGGQPAKDKSTLRVFNPENWERTILLDGQGIGVFKPTMTGLYIVREDWYDPTSGDYEGKAYSSIRHRCNYCIWIN